MKSQLQYVADGGYCCPRCDSEYIEDTLGRDSIDNYYYRDFECTECGLRYTEEYILNGYWVMADGIDNGSTLVEHLRQALRDNAAEVERLRAIIADISTEADVRVGQPFSTANLQLDAIHEKCLEVSE